jgi:hypothetical protein
VVTASGDRNARIWDAASGSEAHVLNGHTDRVDSAAFSGDGKRVVTASWDGSARIWDAESGTEVAVLNGHAGPGSARIWDAESGTQIAVLNRHAGPVRSATFSSDSKRAVTASDDNTARIWDVTWATLIRDDVLRERVCAEKLVGTAQKFSDSEMEDPILRGIDKNDPVARNPCLRRGPLSLDYWTRLPGQFWHSTRWLVGAD